MRWGLQRSESPASRSEGAMVFMSLRLTAFVRPDKISYLVFEKTVQIRHYPVTVSVESLPFCSSHWDENPGKAGRTRRSASQETCQIEIGLHSTPQGRVEEYVRTQLWQLPTYGSRSAECAFMRLNARSNFVQQLQPNPRISTEDVDMLSGLVLKIEAMEGVLAHWSIPGARTESAAYEVARTVCRRAERAVVRIVETGGCRSARRRFLSQSSLRRHLALRSLD
jgi:hypothetical protein